MLSNLPPYSGNCLTAKDLLNTNFTEIQAPNERIVLEVAISDAADKTFIIPCMGSADAANGFPGGKIMKWLVFWGDGSAEVLSFALGATYNDGLLHTYDTTGQYVIQIYPADVPNIGWAKGFGWNATIDAGVPQSTTTNRNKLIHVHELPDKGTISTATAVGGSWFASSFRQCEYLLTASLPRLETVRITSFDNPMVAAFRQCTRLHTVYNSDWGSLVGWASVGQLWNETYRNCRALKDLSGFTLPNSLKGKTVPQYGAQSCFECNPAITDAVGHSPTFADGTLVYGDGGFVPADSTCIINVFSGRNGMTDWADMPSRWKSWTI